MASLERQLVVCLFTDTFAMPAPVVGFIWTLCHSESGALLSTFAIATFGLALCLHVRETLESVKQFFKRVNAISDLIIALMEGDGEENGRNSAPSIRDEQLRMQLQHEEDMQARVLAWANQAALPESKNVDFPDTFVQAEIAVNTPATAAAEGQGYLRPSYDTQDVTSSSKLIGLCELNQQAPDAQFAGGSECPAKALAVLDCSDPLPALETPGMQFYTQAPAFRTVKTFNSSNARGERSSVATCKDHYRSIAPDDTMSKDVNMPSTVDEDMTFAESESMYSATAMDRNSSAYDASSSSIDLDEQIACIDTTKYSRPNTLLVSLSVSDSLSVRRGEEPVPKDHTELSRAKSSTYKGSVRPSIPARLSSSKLDECVPASMSSHSINAPKSMKRHRRYSDFGTRDMRPFSGTFRTLPLDPVPLKVADRMRRRALDLMAESVKLKDSSLCMIFEHMNPSYDVHTISGLERLDLHHQPEEEAVILARLHLDFCRKMFVECTEIITGRGRHSKGGIPVLRPAIAKELSYHPDVLVSDTNPNPGSFIVRFSRPFVIEERRV